MKKTLFIATLFAAFSVACTDLSGIEKQLSDVNSRIDAIEINIKSLNQDIQALAKLKNGAVVSSATNSNGLWTVILSDGTTMHLGESSSVTSNVPVFKVDAEGYWIVDLQDGLGYQYILDVDGHKVNAKGYQAPAPVIGVDAEGYWIVDGVRVLDAEGKPIRAVSPEGDSIFKKVEVTGGYLILTLKNDDVIRVPYADGFKCVVKAEGLQKFGYGETIDFEVELLNAVNAFVLKPEGWKTILSSDKLSITAPQQVTKSVLFDSETTVTLVAVSAQGFTATNSFEVQASNTPSKPVSYYQLYEAGEDIEINGVTYNKTNHPDFLVIEESPLSGIDAKGKIVFIKDGVDLTINTWPHFENTVIIGDKIGERSHLVIPSGKQIALESNGSTVLYNIDFEYGHSYVFNTKVEYDKISIVNCSVTCTNEAANTLITMNNGGNTVKNIEIVDSEIYVSVNGSTIVNNGSKNVSMSKLILRNNIICGGTALKDYEFVKNATGTTISSVEIKNNTLYNIWHAGWFGFLNCNAGKMGISNNLYVTSGDTVDTYRQLLYCAIKDGSDPEYDVKIGTNYYYTNVMTFAACKQAGGTNMDAATKASIWPFVKDASQVVSTKDFKQVEGYKNYGAQR